MLNRFLFNVGVGSTIYGLVIVVNIFFVSSAIYTIIALSVLTVVLIIFGDDLEQIFIRKDAAQDTSWLLSIVEAILSREALLPCFLLAGLWSTGLVKMETIISSTTDKIDIIFLILTFAVFAQGIKHSGYFKYAAYRVLEVCDGKMTRMILYLFALTSVLTFVTSNDIVILVMTPIVLELCRQAHISNAKLLLMSQFVAANTLSMGLLIGSPTNIIIANEISLNFFDYFSLMLLPSILSVTTGFLALYAINMLFQKYLNGWQCSSRYLMPALKEQPDFTNEMRLWICGFITILIGVSIISHFYLPFFYVTVPGMIFALGVLSTLKSKEIGKEDPLKQCMASLPYQIFFFALTFFAISETLAEHLPFSEILRFFTDQSLWWNSFSTLYVIGLLVNVINDLPAAAIAGEIAIEASGLDSLNRQIFIQSMLVALNIGCYVTPIGALAGIIWFHLMRDSEGVKTPTRLGMVIYGLTHFIVVSIILSILIPFTNLLIDWLFSTEFSTDPETNWGLLTGCLGPLLVFSLFTLVLKKQNIRLIDMRAFLSAASWVNVRSRNSGVAFQIGIALLVTTWFIGAIWYAEGDPRMGSNVIKSVGDFIVWSITFLGSGFESGWFPQRPIARIIAGIMPILAIFLIIRTLQVTSDASSLENISRKIAHGEITTRRSIFVGYHHYMRPVVRSIWKRNNELGIFQTVLYTHETPPLKWKEERDYDNIYSEKISLDNFEIAKILLEDYCADRSDEIYLLSKKFYGERGKSWVREMVLGIQNILNPQDDDELDADTIFSKQRQFESITEGEDPEDHAGRLPRIFIWDDADPGAEEIGPEMEKLLIHLPAKWREFAKDERNRHKLSQKLCKTIAQTANCKSWKERRKLIAEYCMK